MARFIQIAAVALAGAMLAGMPAFSSAQAGTIKYTLNTFSGTQFYPPFADTATITLTGHIKTDGFVGKLALSDITAFDFQFKIADKTGTVTHVFNNTDSTTWFFFQGELSATKKGLFFNFDVANGFPDRNLIDLGGTGSDGAFSELFLQGPSSFSTSGITFDTINAGNTLNLGIFLPKTGKQQIAATPIPAALPLFAAGLGLFGLLGWQRKRTA